MIELLIGSGLLTGIATVVALGASLGLRELKQCPRVTCAEAKPGKQRVKLEGIARTDAPLVSPLSKKECLYYSLEVTELTARGDNRSDRERLTGSRIWTHWWLEDDSGALPVDAEGADTTALTWGADTGFAGGLAGADADLRELLRGYGATDKIGSSWEVREELIPVDSRVFVCAEVKRTPEGPILAGSTRMIVSTKSEKEYLRRDSTVFAVASALAVAGLVGIAFGAFDLLTQQEPPASAVDSRIRSFNP